MPIHWVYVLYTSALAAILIILVPRHEIRRLLPAAVLAGAIGDLILIFLLKPFHVAAFQAFGPFGFMGIPFFPPIAWTIFFIIYFYFLPRNTWMIYPYVLAAGAFGVLFGNLLVNLGILWFSHRLLVPLAIYPLWFAIVTWIYVKTTQSGKQMV